MKQFIGAIGAIAALLALPASAHEPNDTFAAATVLSPGVLVVSDDLRQPPDTLLGSRNPIFGGIELVDDDGSPVGNGFASGLQGVPTNSGQLRFAITGFGDEGFVGSHAESGRYEVIVQPYNFFGDALNDFREIRTMQPGVVDEFSYFDADWIGGSYDVYIDNLIDFEGVADVDFFTFTGLTAGASFVAATLDPLGSLVDTRLGWFSAAGSLLDADDDSGPGGLSLLQGVVPANGQVTLAVSGGVDVGFAGDHQARGAYELQLTIGGGGFAADFNNDGRVNADDLLFWKTAYGATAAGDADGDNDSDGADFLIWQRQFGGAASAAAAPVPEPALAASLASTLIAVTAIRRLRQPPA